MLVFLGFAAVASAQVKVHVYTSLPTDGFVTAESKVLQTIVQQASKVLAKEKKLVVLTDDATVSVEVMSYELIRNGTTQLVAGRTLEILQEQAHSVLRIGDHVTNLDTTVSTAESYSPSVGERLGYQIRTWIKDNAERLK